MNEVIIQLTIEKSDWLDAEAIRARIADNKQFAFLLATGGCKLTDVKVVEQPKTDQPAMAKLRL
jgi:hypothetical protein